MHQLITIADQLVLLYQTVSEGHIESIIIDNSITDNNIKLYIERYLELYDIIVIADIVRIDKTSILNILYIGKSKHKPMIYSIN